MTISKAKRKAMFERDQWRCVVCGFDARNSLELGKMLTAGHILPSSRGGTDALENIQSECRQCNKLKKNTLPAELTLRLRRTWVDPHPHRPGRTGLRATIIRIDAIPPSRPIDAIAEDGPYPTPTRTISRR